MVGAVLVVVIVVGGGGMLLDSRHPLTHHHLTGWVLCLNKVDKGSERDWCVGYALT